MKRGQYSVRPLHDTQTRSYFASPTPNFCSTAFAFGVVRQLSYCSAAFSFGAPFTIEAVIVIGS